MKIKSFLKQLPVLSGEFTERNPNISYLLTFKENSAYSVLIDANIDPDILQNELTQEQSTLTYILITHAHHDHITTLPQLAKRFPETRIGIHRLSLQNVDDKYFNNLFLLEDKTTIKIGDEILTVIHSPGHSFDSICFWSPKEKILFSGDTILGGGIGCCDYGTGGNRNFFYQTISYLLQLLPSDTLIFPSHHSEYLNVMPPYYLSVERENNPYLVNVLQGKRGAFDKLLKNFSAAFETDDCVIMDESYIDEIYQLEKQTWIPDLQASRESILQRLHHGHKILGLKKNRELMGMIAWRYSKFSILDGIENFPKLFSDFSIEASYTGSDVQSAFIYNVGVRAGFRQGGIGSRLLQGVFEKIRDDGVKQVFLDSRIPSYNGSLSGNRDKIRQSPKFKSAIDRYLTDGTFPTQEEFALDPRLRYYMQNGFKPLFILKDFIQDLSSGNNRVICYINLEQDN
jgi:glyoxylase-like metal-dependent hydrolase (beta-lactamase superfamily II)/ribosomal protein S18 acetylase RimI-like enzyme